MALLPTKSPCNVSAAACWHRGDEGGRALIVINVFDKVYNTRLLVTGAFAIMALFANYYMLPVLLI